MPASIIKNYLHSDISDALGKKQIIRTMNYRGSLMSTSLTIPQSVIKSLEAFEPETDPTASEYSPIYLCNISAYATIKSIKFGVKNVGGLCSSTNHNTYLFEIYPSLLVKDHLHYDGENHIFSEDSFIAFEGVENVGCFKLISSNSTTITDPKTNVISNMMNDGTYAQSIGKTMYSLLKDASKDDDASKLKFEQQEKNMNVALMMRLFKIDTNRTTNQRKMDGVGSDMYITIDYVEGNPSGVSNPDIAYSGIYKKQS